MSYGYDVALLIVVARWWVNESVKNESCTSIEVNFRKCISEYR